MPAVTVPATPRLLDVDKKMGAGFTCRGSTWFLPGDLPAAMGSGDAQVGLKAALNSSDGSRYDSNAGLLTLQIVAQHRLGSSLRSSMCLTGLLKMPSGSVCCHFPQVHEALSLKLAW